MTKSDSSSSEPVPPVTLFRRFGAILYDILPLFALLGLATAPWLWLRDGEAVEAGNLGFRLYLVAWLVAYFVVSWAFGGQTIGMRAWRLQLVGESGEPPDWRAVTLRFAAALLSWACLGLGFLAALWHPQNHTWHDRLSRTYLRRNP